MRYLRTALVGAAALCISGCGDPEIIVPELLSVDILPSHGAAQISIDVEALAVFSHEVADPSAASQAISFACLGTPPCASPTTPGNCAATTTATVTFEPNNKVARILPSAALARNTCYAVTVAQGIKASDENVGPLPSDIQSSFLTQP